MSLNAPVRIHSTNNTELDEKTGIVIGRYAHEYLIVLLDNETYATKNAIPFPEPYGRIVPINCLDFLQNDQTTV